MYKFFAIILACVFSVSVFAKTYYVSPEGTGTAAGTLQAPLTFAAAVSKLIAGDSVIVRGGFYSFSSTQTMPTNTRYLQWRTEVLPVGGR